MTNLTLSIDLVWAIGFLLAAHVVRVLRWRILLSGVDVNTSNLRPLTALSVGYLFNALFPFRLGEFIRCAMLTQTTRSRFTTVLGTIIIERFVDLIVVTFITFVLAYGSKSILHFAYWHLILLLSIFSLFLFINYVPRIKRLAWSFASVFNEKNKSAILHLVFLLIDLLFKKPYLRRWRFWLITLIMWLLYLISLFLLSDYLEISFVEVYLRVYMLSDELILPSVFDVLNGYFFIYFLSPIVLVLVYAYISGFNAFAWLARIMRELTKLEYYSSISEIGRLHGFRSDTQYHAFLNRFFCGQTGLLADFEQKGIADVHLHRVFHGGSGAVTALVEVNDALRVRKFASGSLAAKLEIQHDWLLQYNSQLPLVNVISSYSDEFNYFYDMSYVGGCLGLYEAIHTLPLDKSIVIFDEVLESLFNFHTITEVEVASDDLVRSYVNAKVISNYEIIKREFSELFELESLEINGKIFDIKDLELFNDVDWLVEQLCDRRQCSIHGDMTIENIMLITAVSNNNWFLIDPNPINVFQSPLIDFSKLMQSLHLGYESLHRMPKASLSVSDSRGALSIALHRSTQYEKIYAHVVNKLNYTIGEDKIKEIYLHECINYMRLIPYQLKTSHEAGLAFFACLCMLISEYQQKYK